MVFPSSEITPCPSCVALPIFHAWSTVFPLRVSITLASGRPVIVAVPGANVYDQFIACPLPSTPLTSTLLSAPIVTVCDCRGGPGLNLDFATLSFHVPTNGLSAATSARPQSISSPKVFFMCVFSFEFTDSSPGSPPRHSGTAITACHPRSLRRHVFVLHVPVRSGEPTIPHHASFGINSGW